jgi:dienelactone hydrolase
MGIATAVTLAVAPSASAAPDFYIPPTPLPSGSNGDLIRTGPSVLVPSVPGVNGQFPGTATRLMYRSEDANDKPIAVTGTYIDPALDWKGKGPRPVVAVAPGTQGQGDQCAPSKMLNQLITYVPPIDVMVEYELLTINALLLQGIAVVITDYQGLGTPGAHTYVNRAAEAHAVLDSVRAAQNLPNTKITSDGPVGMWGYSQGGGATAAAAELASEYAPELDIKGTYAGAPPADLAATLAQVDGTSLTGVIGYTLNGLRESNPELNQTIDDNINPAGQQMLATVANQCVGATVLTVGFHRTSEYTRTGQSLSDLLKTIPVAGEVFAANKIGNRTPNAPVYVSSGTTDDIVPHGQAVELARDWCAKGANVTLNNVELPPILPGLGAGHALPLLITEIPGMQWLGDRLNDVPTGGNCGA